MIDSVRLSVCSSHIISYHIIDLKRQNRLKVVTNKPKLKVKMQSVSDDDVRKRLLEQTRFELAAKGVFRLGRMLHLLAEHSRSSDQQLGKHGYRRLITAMVSCQIVNMAQARPISCGLHWSDSSFQDKYVIGSWNSLDTLSLSKLIPQPPVDISCC